MMRVRAAVIILALWLVSLAAHASDDPLTNRGINLSGVYHIGDIDTVNLFNGNLIIDVPMAAQFPLNGGFSYGIHLIYTGQPWDFPESLRWDDFLQEDVYRAAPIPNRRSNAGMGWRVSIGRLIAPGDPTNMDCDQGNFFIGSCAEWVYESPDGAEHRIGSSEPGYSADGTYLRLKSYTANNVTYREIEFPDGMIHRFDSDGNLTAIYTPFDRAANAGPSVSVDYLSGATDCGDPDASCWKISDIFGRTQYVTFASTPDAIYGHQLAQKIIVTAPGSGTVTYSLHYAEVNLPLDSMSCYHGLGGVGPGRWDDISSYSVPLLTSIGLPDGSDYEMAYFNDDPPQCSQGSLRTLTLPTKGSIGYTYTNWAHNNLLATIDGPGHGAPYVPGVYSRTKTPAGGGDAQVWKYESQGQDGALIPCGGCQNPSSEWRERMVTITDPAPDKRTVRHYFSIADFQDEGWQPREYGLPLTHRSGTATTDPSTNPAESRYLSSEVLDALGNVERSTYVKYEYTIEDTLERPGAFHREQASLTRYAGDAGRWSSVNRSSFDYAGHYRQTETDGNFASEGTTGFDHRTEFTDYNPGKSAFSNWDANSKWMLNTFDFQTVNTPKIGPNDGLTSHTKKTEFCFEADTGFLTRRRVLRYDPTTRAGSGRDGTDLITVFGRVPEHSDADPNDHTGNLYSERSYGGDGANLPDGALCDITLTSPRYEIQHRYLYGVRKTSQYFQSDGTAMPFFTLDRTIGLSGTVLKERDVAGVETTYTFDSNHPLQIGTVTTTGTTDITYAYRNASGSGSSFTPAQITITQSDVTSRVQYDSFGRMWREFRTMPVIGEVSRETLYDSSNRKVSQSVWDTSSYTNKTSFEYDFLGRLDKVTQPDGTFVTTSYLGDSRRTTTSEVVSSTDAPPATASVSTVEQMDRYGRIWYLKEPNDNVTAYGYGVTGALARVCMNATLTGGVLSTASCGQERTFAYDNRGFLTDETHPENGTVSYTYDALGHVLTKRLAATGPFDLNYTYDDAERLTQVKSRETATSASFRVSKLFAFGTSNGVSNMKLGKLETATRHNYRPVSGSSDVDIQITETYAYNDLAGRLTDRTTEIKDLTTTGGINQTVTQKQDYTTIGQVSSLTYPSCSGVPCGETMSTSVGLTHTNGWLTDITPAATYATFGYHPSGMINTVTHGNGVIDTQSINTNGMPRPDSITFDGFGSCVRPAFSSSPDPTLDSAAILSGTEKVWTVSASGSGTLFYQWYKDGVPAAETSATLHTGPLTDGPHDYFVRVANSCGMIQSNTARVTIAPSLATPCCLSAAMPNTLSVQPVHLTWGTSSGADHYEIWRRDHAGPFQRIDVSASASYDDHFIAADTAYFYQVCASPAPATPCTSAFSNQDLATTVAFRDISVDPRIHLVDLTQLLTAVNAVRAASAGSAGTPVTWGDILQSSPAPTLDDKVYGEHIMALRTQMEAALQPLGFSPHTYVDPILPSSPRVIIKAIHITELRDRIQ